MGKRFLLPRGPLEGTEWKKEYDSLILLTKVKGRRESDREQNQRERLEVLEYYGGYPPRCACCGVTEVVFLCVDHINGGGNKHREEIGRGCSIHRWLRKNGFPLGYQVLCHNCNIAKTRLGYCPHHYREESLTSVVRV